MITIDININTIEYILSMGCIVEHIRPTTPIHNRAMHNMVIKAVFNMCLYSWCIVNNVLMILIYQKRESF